MKRFAAGLCALMLTLAVAGTAARAALEIATRFGRLQIVGEFGNALSFKGRRVVQAHNALSHVETYRFGKDGAATAADVLLIEETGGSACPALYYFVRVSASGAAKATPAFGTCSEQTGVMRRGDAIVVTMPGYQGPFESAAARARAARERHVFTYRNGAVTESRK